MNFNLMSLLNFIVQIGKKKLKFLIEGMMEKINYMNKMRKARGSR